MENDARIEQKSPAAPFTLTTIDHVVLRVANLERSVAFYRDVVGCALDRRRPELGMVHMRAGNAMIDLLDTNGPRQGGGNGVVVSRVMV